MPLETDADQTDVEKTIKDLKSLVQISDVVIKDFDKFVEIKSILNDKYNDYIHAARVKMMDYTATLRLHHRPINLDQGAHDDELTVTGKHEDKHRHKKLKVERLQITLPEDVIRSGLGYINAKGEDLFPKITESNSHSHNELNAFELVDADKSRPIALPIDLKEETEVFPKGIPPLGIKIRVWHDNHNVRGEFLGEITIGYKVILRHYCCCHLMI